MTEPWVKLSGHEKRVSLLQWHPTAEYILASGGGFILRFMKPC